MKTWNHLGKSGPAAAVLVAGVLVVATGCVEHRVTYVRPAYPVRVESPAAPPPPPVVAVPPAQVVVLPAVTPPPPVAPLHPAAVLDRMLAPIALYPDPLLAQVLPAATLPWEVVEVDRYLREGGSVYHVDGQPWDSSLKALARYPATLRMMAENLTWTTDLGQAFLTQPADVMNSVQRLRAQARAFGHLRSTPEQTVVIHGGVIEILPASPQVIYVPVYEPQIVYVRPPPAPGRFHISFGVGLMLGPWLNHDCDWHQHRVIVWHHERPRPTDWWNRPAHRRQTQEVAHNVTVVNNTTIVNQNFTVWRPQARAAVAGSGGRAPSPQVIRASAPARNETARPAAEAVRQLPVTVQKLEPAPEIRPTPPTHNVAAPAPKVVRQAPVTVQRPAPVREVQPVVPAQVETRRPARQDLRQPAATVEKPVPAPEPREPAPAKVQPAAPTREAVRPAVAVAAPQPAPARQVRPSPASEARPEPRAMRPTQRIVVPKEGEDLPAPKAAKEPGVTSSSPRPAMASAIQPVEARAGAQRTVGAPAAIESARVTREPVARGQQDRNAAAKSAAARPEKVRPARANSAETNTPAGRKG